MNTLLANLNLLYVKTHTFHYNVTGSDFLQAHLFLENEYETIHNAIDTIAERIKIDGHAPLTSMRQFLAEATLAENEINKISSTEAYQILLSDYQILLAQIKDLKTSQTNNTVATLEELEQQLEKTIWFLKATINI